MKKTSNILTNELPSFSLGQNNQLNSFSIDDDIEETEIDKTKIVKELTDEIKSLRQSKHEFEATNDHQTYLVVCFSTKEDKEEFCKNVNIQEHTYVDGYKLANDLGVSPNKPKFKLKKPLEPHHGKK